MNVLGWDVAGWDREAFFSTIRLLVLAVIGASAWLHARRRVRAFWLACGALFLLLVLGWSATILPLQRIYGLELPGDRHRNLTWVNSVAAGNSPLSTGRVGEISLEPFWAWFAGSLIRGRPDRSDALFALLPLGVQLLLGAILIQHFRRAPKGMRPREGLGLCVAFVVLLVATGPLDFLQPFRAFSNKTFFLKPNHALGFILLPLLVALFASTRRAAWLASALVLGLLGWAFLVHWAFFGIALGVHLLLVAIWSRERTNEVFLRSLVVGAVSVLLVAPYIWLMNQQYPYALSLAAVEYPDAPTRSIWGDMMPTGSSMFFLASIDRGLLFLFGIVGLVGWLKRKEPKDLFWSAMLVSSYVLWVVNYIGYLTARAREADEFYYFLVFNLAVAGAHGAWWTFEWLRRQSQTSLGLDPSTRGWLSLALVATVLVFVQPYWWHPERMDGHFRLGLPPIDSDVLEVRDWVLRETSGRDVFLGEGDLAFWVSGLTGRQILPPRGEPSEVLTSVLDESEHDGIRYGDVYVLFTSSMTEVLEMRPEQMGRRGEFERVFQNPLVSIFRISGKSGVPS
jgi:hypothetical protein